MKITEVKNQGKSVLSPKSLVLSQKTQSSKSFFYLLPFAFYLIIFVILFFCGIARAELTSDQKLELFKQANDIFRTAGADANDAGRKEGYAKAAVLYERLISEGDVHNSKLYYNLANSYFLGGNLGKAIVNYNRAIKYDRYDENIHKNLAFARSKTIDRFEVKTTEKIFKTIFFWHYDFSLKTRYVGCSVGLGLFCIFIGIIFLKGKRGWLIGTAAVCIVFAAAMAGSAALEEIQGDKQKTGVITVAETIARQGDGMSYSPSFKEPLHEGTEFELIEDRGQWIHIRLADDSDCWIIKDDAEII